MADMFTLKQMFLNDIKEYSSDLILPGGHHLKRSIRG